MKDRMKALLEAECVGRLLGKGGKVVGREVSKNYFMYIIKTNIREQIAIICLLIHNVNNTYIHIYTYTHKHIDTDIYTYIYIYTHTYIHTYKYTFIHKYTYTYIHTHIRSYIHLLIHNAHNTFIHTSIYPPELPKS